jgi:hypothetical protein
MKRCLALLLLFASCSGCTLFEAPPAMSNASSPTPAWLTTSTPPPSSTYFKRPFE